MSQRTSLLTTAKWWRLLACLAGGFAFEFLLLWPHTRRIALLLRACALVHLSIYLQLINRNSYRHRIIPPPPVRAQQVAPSFPCNTSSLSPSAGPSQCSYSVIAADGLDSLRMSPARYLMSTRASWCLRGRCRCTCSAAPRAVVGYVVCRPGEVVSMGLFVNVKRPSVPFRFSVSDTA
jgi:hypothetical protein